MKIKFNAVKVTIQDQTKTFKLPNKQRIFVDTNCPLEMVGVIDAIPVKQEGFPILNEVGFDLFFDLDWKVTVLSEQTGELYFELKCSVVTDKMKKYLKAKLGDSHESINSKIGEIKAQLTRVG